MLSLALSTIAAIASVINIPMPLRAGQSRTFCHNHHLRPSILQLVSITLFEICPPPPSLARRYAPCPTPPPPHGSQCPALNERPSLPPVASLPPGSPPASSSIMPERGPPHTAARRARSGLAVFLRGNAW